MAEYEEGLIRCFGLQREEQPSTQDRDTGQADQSGVRKDDVEIPLIHAGRTLTREHKGVSIDKITD